MQFHVRMLGVVLLATGLVACAAPKPLARDQLVTQGRDYLARRTADAAEFPAAWTLDAAVRRALVSNVDYRISRLEATLATGNRKLASLDMLPQLMAEAGYQNRTTTEVSTASDDESVDAQLYLSFDVIDFSMAWLRARELGDQALMAEENRRRVVQMTIRDVAYAWYQARAYAELAPEFVALREQVNTALQQSDEIVRQRLGNPLQAVEYRSALLLLLRRIDSVSLQLDQSRDELARLLHLPAGVEPAIDPAGAPSLENLASLPPLASELWQAAALVNRPELRQTRYEARSMRTAAKRRLLEVFPRLLFRYGSNYDSNNYLSSNEWDQGSAQLSMNLMKLASVPGLRRNLKLNRALADLREEAMAGAVLSQVSIAGKAYERSRSSWCFSKSLLAVNERRSELLGARSQAAAIDNLSYIRARLDALLLRTESALQFAELQKARMTLVQSVGLLDVPADLDQEATSAALTALVSGELSAPARAELQTVAGEFELPAPDFAAVGTPAAGCAP